MEGSWIAVWKSWEYWSGLNVNLMGWYVMDFLGCPCPILRSGRFCMCDWREFAYVYTGGRIVHSFTHRATTHTYLSFHRLFSRLFSFCRYLLSSRFSISLNGKCARSLLIGVFSFRAMGFISKRGSGEL